MGCLAAWLFTHLLSPRQGQGFCCLHIISSLAEFFLCFIQLSRQLSKQSPIVGASRKIINGPALAVTVGVVSQGHQENKE